MAIRCDAATDGMERTTNLPTVTAVTAMGWAYVLVAPTVQQGMLWMLGKTDGSFTYQDIDIDPITGKLGYQSGSQGSVISLSTWFHWCITINGTGAGAVTGYLNGNVDFTANGSATNVAQKMWFGNGDADGAGGVFPLNCRLFGLKTWSAVLTQAEIQLEMTRNRPWKTASLNSWYPCVQSAVTDNLADWSGNGYTLTQDGTLTVEANITSVPLGQIMYIGSASLPADNGTNTSATPAVTPPVQAEVGDLVYFIAATRDNVGVSMAISQASGQSWSSLAAFANTNMTGQIFYCRFNGTWGSDPSIAVTGGSSPYEAVLHVFRPSASANLWFLDQAQATATFAAPGSPFTVSITGQTPSGISALTIAAWGVASSPTWGTLTGTGWTVTGTAQYRNTSGSDICTSFAHVFTLTGAAAPTVSKNQSAGNAGATSIVTFSEIPFAGEIISSPQSVKRASLF